MVEWSGDAYLGKGNVVGRQNAIISAHQEQGGVVRRFGDDLIAQPLWLRFISCG